MYQYTFDDQTTQEINNSTKKSNDLLQQFGEIDNKYNTLTTSNQDLTLEKLQYIKPTQEEVKKDAENSLVDYKTSNLESINNNYSQKVSDIDKSIQLEKDSTQEQKEQIENAYKNAKQNASQDAIKRGLARSSIIVNTLSNYDQNMISDLSKATQALNSKIADYTNQKSLLEQQKQNALNSFDIAYAVKLQDQINSINKSIQEKEEEVIKYNNQIAELEAEWEKQQTDDNFEKTESLAKIIGTYGSGVLDVLKQNEKFTLAKNYLNTLSKQEALDELENNPIYSSNLGNTNYKKLKEQMEQR